ncbi:hypothetical protein F4804DRAFT_339484 [Jackrogersella minutella]|nr:hypothetical protein F4804DRAFT_339484 [Jackrogersella minutella]
MTDAMMQMLHNQEKQARLIEDLTRQVVTLTARSQTSRQSSPARSSHGATFSDRTIFEGPAQHKKGVRILPSIEDPTLPRHSSPARGTPALSTVSVGKSNQIRLKDPVALSDGIDPTFEE